MTTSTLALSLASTARADDADKLVADGQAAMAKSDYKTACPKLRQAEALKPALPTLRALAQCDDKAGSLPEAYQEYGELSDRAKAAYSDDIVKEADGRRAAIAQNLARMTLVYPRTSKLTFSIELDHVVLDANRLFVELLVGAGTHHLKVTTNGPPDTQMDTDFNLPGNMAKSTVKIPLDKPNEIDAPAPSTNPTPAPVQTVIIQQPGGAPATPTVPMQNNKALVGLGGAAIGLGAIGLFTSMGFAISAQTNDDDSRLATGIGITGLLLTSGGIVLTIVGSIKHPVVGAPSDTPASPTASWVPDVDLGIGSASARWHF